MRPDRGGSVMLRREPSLELSLELSLDDAGRTPADEVLRCLASSSEGLEPEEVRARLAAFGPNAIGRRHAGPLGLLGRQLRNPLLALLLSAAVVSFAVGQRSDALVIGSILLVSVALGFGEELRSERAARSLEARISHRQLTVRSGRTTAVDPVELVPGDVVLLRLGDIVPADLRLLQSTGLECDESVLTGESAAVAKRAEAVGDPACARLGTVVRSGAGVGVVVATGSRTAFGRIADQLGTHRPQTAFQHGLAGFSRFLAGVAAVLTTAIFVTNLALHRSLLTALLFSLAIAIGITPQLLPAIVSVSLAAGSRRLARRKVLVKRLVAIEDLGNTELLITDKTGTLTEGAVTVLGSVDADNVTSPHVLALARVCSDVAGDAGAAVAVNALDDAIVRAAPLAPGWTVVARLPFDHERRCQSVLAEGPEGRTLITKGAPESVLARCSVRASEARTTLDALTARASRVVAVAARTVGPEDAAAARVRGLTRADECDLELVGFVELSDAPKTSAGPAVARLAALGIDVRIATGDHPDVAVAVCRAIGIPVVGVVTGAEMDALDDDALHETVARTTVFARVDPTQKARLVDVERAAGRHVAFLGDGVNDAVALHKADVGISVDSAADVAKDAAGIVLLEKDLDVLADGVTEGRAVFANTVKYVLMATSSNFGNMFSAAAASAFMSFLPMLPSQILLNNLLYDLGEMTIPTDHVDAAQLQRPAHWDVGMIRRFMLVFGPVSSLFDIVTFVLLRTVLHAGPDTFRSGWFVESLATQTLVVFVIRTHRTPFFRSRPSRALAVSTLACVAVGVALPFSPLAARLGFDALPLRFVLALGAMVVLYLALVEAVKAAFFRRLENHPSTSHLVAPSSRRPIAAARDAATRHVHARASRWSHPPRRRGRDQRRRDDR